MSILIVSIFSNNTNNLNNKNQKVYAKTNKPCVKTQKAPITHGPHHFQATFVPPLQRLVLFVFAAGCKQRVKYAVNS